ncbi:MAG: UDP-N-acetylmuramate--L-alanine ligase [Bacteroidetes bacterium HGW-Bacteroidetes-17]|jgi:UDP-N-acetylmuramate--alanine ligase|nr:MAG: UDP-N-acetylmuramate--L-alanine ligase [Bacteroidetes bacterium HGW-Bacteroidetes-17]
MNLYELKHIYFIGIGGIGMSALARYFMQKGIKVSAYDKTETKLTKLLEEEGIHITFKDEVAEIPGLIDLVVYTPAIPSDHKQFNYFKTLKTPILKRSALLGELSKNKFTIAIAGTHGKTTITSLVAHIFITAGIKVSAFVGGITKNYNTNFVGSADAEVVIAEADEYDRSFLTLSTDISLISSMDADHLDIYHNKMQLVESFKLFADNGKPNSHLIVNHRLKSELGFEKCFTYNLDSNADFYGDDITIVNAAYEFNIHTSEGILKDLQFKIPGRHNLENVVAAVSVAKLYGIKDQFIKDALETYRGVERRFDILLNRPDCVYIDDYAHHPEELRACILAVKEFYPGKKITGIFQPHLFSRTRDFADEFARSLEQLDELILLEIYPAREKPIDGINATFLLDKVNLKNKYLFTNEQVLNFISAFKPGVLLTVGAGDIDKLVQPIKERLI